MGACCSKDDANPQGGNEPSKRKTSLKMRMDMETSGRSESTNKNTYEKDSILNSADAQDYMDNFFTLPPEEQKARKSTIVQKVLSYKNVKGFQKISNIKNKYIWKK